MPRKRRLDNESPIQIAIVDYLRRVLPKGCLVHHCRNEINRSGETYMRELAKAKKKGALTGFPDLIVLTFMGVFLLEVKAEGNYADLNQKAMHQKLRHLGFNVAVVRSIDDVRECLAEWGVSTIERVPVIGQIS